MPTAEPRPRTRRAGEDGGRPRKAAPGAPERDFLTIQPNGTATVHSCTSARLHDLTYRHGGPFGYVAASCTCEAGRSLGCRHLILLADALQAVRRMVAARPRSVMVGAQSDGRRCPRCDSRRGLRVRLACWSETTQAPSVPLYRYTCLCCEWEGKS